MFKVKMIDSEYGAIPEIVENDRGNWVVRIDEEIGTITIVGFGSENTITCHVAGMQDGTTDVALVHQGCDDPLKIAHAKLNPKVKFDMDELTDHVNELLAQVISYPEEL